VKRKGKAIWSGNSNGKFDSALEFNGINDWKRILRVNREKSRGKKEFKKKKATGSSI
jgi:hypothetical protein